MVSECWQGEIMRCFTVLAQSLWHDCDKTLPDLHKEHSEMWLNIAIGSKSDDWIMGHNGKENPNCNSTLLTVQKNNASRGTHCELERCNHENLSPHKAWNLGWFIEQEVNSAKPVGGLLSLALTKKISTSTYILSSQEDRVYW